MGWNASPWWCGAVPLGGAQIASPGSHTVRTLSWWDMGPPVVQPKPLSSALWFFWVGVGRGWVVGRSMSHDKVRAHLNLGQTPATTTSLRTAHRASLFAPRLQSSRSKLRTVSSPFPLSPLSCPGRPGHGIEWRFRCPTVLRLRRRRRATDRPLERSMHFPKSVVPWPNCRFNACPLVKHLSKRRPRETEGRGAPC